MADRPHPSSIAGGPCAGTTFSYIPGPASLRVPAIHR
jgi:hypothetical protein